MVPAVRSCCRGVFHERLRTSKPPFTAETKVLTPKQYSSQNPPEVRVRSANPEETKNIAEFPGKKDQELSAKIDSAGGPK